MKRLSLSRDIDYEKINQQYDKLDLYRHKHFDLIEAYAKEEDLWQIEDEKKKAFLMEKRDEIEAFMKTAPTVLA